MRDPGGGVTLLYPDRGTGCATVAHLSLCLSLCLCLRILTLGARPPCSEDAHVTRSGCYSQQRQPDAKEGCKQPLSSPRFLPKIVRVHGRGPGGRDRGQQTQPRTKGLSQAETLRGHRGGPRAAANGTPAPEVSLHLDPEGGLGLGVCGSQAGMASTSKATSPGAVEIARFLGTHREILPDMQTSPRLPSVEWDMPAPCAQWDLKHQLCQPTGASTEA